MLKKILFAILVAQSILMAHDGGINSTITSLISYNQYGNGDVVIFTKEKTSACSSGYWITKNDIGFSGNLSMLLSAYQTKSKILIYGLPDNMWKASSGKYCKLYQITLK